MKNFISYNSRAFKAEWLKLKHSGILWICFSASLFIPLMFTIFFLFNDLPFEASDSRIWNSLLESSFKAFTSFFYPVFLIIIVARLVYFEHRYDTWKLLETQPVSRGAIYFAKWQVILVISLMCLIGLLLFSITSGFIIQFAKPKSGLGNASIDWILIGKALLRYWIASFGLITIQYFIGLWNKSFALPLTIGLVATIAGSMLAGFDLWNWWPYSAPANTNSTFSGSLSGNFLMHHEKMSLLWSALFLWLGYQLYIKRGFIRGLLVPIGKLSLTLILLAGFALIAWKINEPVALKPYSKTVIAGEIKSKKPVDNIIIFALPAYDTICVIPVTNEKFHFIATQNIEPGMYGMIAGNSKSQLYFGSNDSIFIKWEISEKNTDLKILGTRVAENEYLGKAEPNDFYYLSNYAYRYQPKDYADEIMDAWKKGVDGIRKFKTADNIKPSEQFLQLQEKFLAIKLLRLADAIYPQVYSLYYPNEQYKALPSLEKLKKAADVEDAGLVGLTGFTSYLSELYRSKTGPNDSVYFSYVQQHVKRQKLRDVLYYDALNNTLPKIKDTLRRTQYLNYYASFIENKKLKAELTKSNERMKSLGRGKPAYLFTGEALNGNDIMLGQLANRYVVVDVWATWCGPCKKESPYFEELAEKYSTDKIAFVAVSVDEEKVAWQMEAPSKSKRVLQLWAKNAEKEFMEKYAVSSIPRFMLIDPKGYIVNANMPSPSDPEFENILLKEISWLRGSSL